MYCESLDIPEVKILRPVRHEDSRGFFSEIYNHQAITKAGIHLDIVQENLAYSKQANTVRGIHFQTPPFAQAKLVQVVRGAIFDVAVDLRAGSPTYGHFVSAEISAANWNQILIPEGFGHGLCTLEPDTQVIYKVTAHYSHEHDAGIRWDDSEIGINWPLTDTPLLSDKDEALPLLKDFDTPFTYEATP
jgi:dTDP-4-dehydrorhamnose 3,5-epimerase